MHVPSRLVKLTPIAALCVAPLAAMATNAAGSKRCRAVVG